jgi:hypothetical protein
MNWARPSRNPASIICRSVQRASGGRCLCVRLPSLWVPLLAVALYAEHSLAQGRLVPAWTYTSTNGAIRGLGLDGTGSCRVVGDATWLPTSGVYCRKLNTNGVEVVSSVVTNAIAWGLSGADSDGSGNTFAAGAQNYDLLFARWAADGLPSWARVVDPSSGSGGMGDVALSPSSGAAYYAAYNRNSDDLTVFRISGAGGTDWERTISSSFGIRGNAVDVSSGGLVFAGGGATGSWGGFTNAGARDCLMVGFNESGSCLWTNIWGTTGWDEVTGIAALSDGSAIALGTTSGIFAGNETTGGGVFVSKVTSSGRVLWTRQINGGSARRIVATPNE